MQPPPLRILVSQCAETCRKQRFLLVTSAEVAQIGQQLHRLVVLLGTTCLDEHGDLPPERLLLPGEAVEMPGAGGGRFPLPPRLCRRLLSGLLVEPYGSMFPGCCEELRHGAFASGSFRWRRGGFLASAQKTRLGPRGVAGQLQEQGILLRAGKGRDPELEILRRWRRWQLGAGGGGGGEQVLVDAQEGGQGRERWRKVAEPGWHGRLHRFQVELLVVESVLVEILVVVLPAAIPASQAR